MTFLRGERAVPLRSVDKSRLRVWHQDITISPFMLESGGFDVKMALDNKVNANAPKCRRCAHQVLNRMDTPEGEKKVWVSCGLQKTPEVACPDGWTAPPEPKPIVPFEMSISDFNKNYTGNFYPESAKAFIRETVSKAHIDKDKPLSGGDDAW